MVSLKEDGMQTDFVKSLDKTFFIVVYLSQDVLIQTDHGLFMINRCQDEMVVIFEGFLLR